MILGGRVYIDKFINQTIWKIQCDRYFLGNTGRFLFSIRASSKLSPNWDADVFYSRQKNTFLHHAIQRWEQFWKTHSLSQNCHSVRFVQVLWASRYDWETSSMFGHEAKIHVFNVNLSYRFLSFSVPLHAICCCVNVSFSISTHLMIFYFSTAHVFHDN